MSLAIDLATIWAFIIAFAVFVYVVMDGEVRQLIYFVAKPYQSAN
jgi:hypothetical protein